MRVTIIGSSDFNDYSYLNWVMTKLRMMFTAMRGLVLICNGEKGAANIAETYARNHSVPMFVIKPNWKKDGEAAKIIRDNEIIDTADIVVAFWDGEDKETKANIDKALAARKRCFVFFDLHTKQSNDWPLSVEESFLQRIKEAHDRTMENGAIKEENEERDKK